jgi:hypothetical protein
MEEFHDISRSVLDDDGSCRDLNFDCPTWAGLGKAFEYLLKAFGVVSATSGEGVEIQDPKPDRLVEIAAGGGTLHVLLNGGQGLFRNMQVFACKDEDGSPFVELTFFPSDVQRPPSLRDDFVQWVQMFRDLLAASRAYARYENASWKQGDAGPSSGVFLAV